MFLFKPIRFHRLFDIRKELFWFYHSFPLLRGNLTLKYLITNGLDWGLWSVDVAHQMLMPDMIKEKES